MASENKCPSCGKPHAFSIVEEGEVDAYVTERDWEAMPIDPEATYRVYVCPSAEGFVVASSEGELLWRPK